jgi:hypothetical protein
MEGMERRGAGARSTDQGATHQEQKKYKKRTETESEFREDSGKKTTDGVPSLLAFHGFPLIFVAARGVHWKKYPTKGRPKKLFFDQVFVLPPFWGDFPLETNFCVFWAFLGKGGSKTPSEKDRQNRDLAQKMTDLPPLGFVFFGWPLGEMWADFGTDVGIISSLIQSLAN